MEGRHVSDEINNTGGSAEDPDYRTSIALFYTGGDVQKAGEMLDGTYRDIHALKAYFTSATLSGAFIIFYNIKHLKLVDSFVHVTSGVAGKNPDPGLSWWEFEKAVNNAVRNEEHDDILGRTLRDGITRSFSIGFITDLNKYLENEDDISLNRLLQKVVQDSLGLQRVEMKVLAESTTSLDVEIKSLTTRKLDRQTLETQKMNAAGQVRAIEGEAASNVPREGVDGVKLILKASFILSPIKGKDVAKLQVGDRIRINLVDRNPRAVSVAKAFNAYDEQNNKFLPVNARIKQIEKIEGNGTEIYALLAKGVLARIVEEEDNIKVAMDPNYVWQVEENAESKANIAGLMVVLLIIAICTAVVIALIKLL
jgi:hypothetical protein